MRRVAANAISETLALADTYAARNSTIARRFAALADQLAIEYLDEAEKQPTTYPRMVSITAFILGVGVTATIGRGATDTGGHNVTVNVAGGLIAGPLVLGLRPVVNDGWIWVREKAMSARARLSVRHPDC